VPLGVASKLAHQPPQGQQVGPLHVLHQCVGSLASGHLERGVHWAQGAPQDALAVSQGTVVQLHSLRGSLGGSILCGCGVLRLLALRCHHQVCASQLLASISACAAASECTGGLLLRRH
jgi:hypothetical protein